MASFLVSEKSHFSYHVYTLSTTAWNRRKKALLILFRGVWAQLFKLYVSLRSFNAVNHHQRPFTKKDIVFAWIRWKIPTVNCRKPQNVEKNFILDSRLTLLQMNTKSQLRFWENQRCLKTKANDNRCSGNQCYDVVCQKSKVGFLQMFIFKQSP